MNTRKILVISASPEGMDAWPAQFDTVFAQTDEAAIELAQRQLFEAIVVDGTDAQLHTAKLRAILPILQPDAALFQHDGARRVQADVQEHFRRERNDRIRRYLVLDDFDAANMPEPQGFSAN